MQQAWGEVQIRRLSTAIGSDRIFVFDNATPDGRWLVGVNQPQKFIGTAKPSYAVLLNVQTGTLRTMHELTNSHSQILAASSDEHWVVWSEVDDMGTFFNWRMLAYSLDTGAVHEVARAVRVDGLPVSGPSPYPVVSHGMVVWGQALSNMEPGKEPQKAVVRMADLTRGTVTTLATSAFGPAFSWPWVAWWKASSTAGVIEVRNLTSGRRWQVDQRPAAIALAGPTLAFNDLDSLAMYVVDDIVADQTPRLITRGEDIADHLEWPKASERLIAWNQWTTTQVYDRLEHRLVELPVPTAHSGAGVYGRLLVWANGIPGQVVPPETTPPENLLVVDISSLPVRP